MESVHSQTATENLETTEVKPTPVEASFIVVPEVVELDLTINKESTQDNQEAIPPPEPVFLENSFVERNEQALLEHFYQTKLENGERYNFKKSSPRERIDIDCSAQIDKACWVWGERKDTEGAAASLRSLMILHQFNKRMALERMDQPYNFLLYTDGDFWRLTDKKLYRELQHFASELKGADVVFERYDLPDRLDEKPDPQLLFETDTHKFYRSLTPSLENGNVNVVTYSLVPQGYEVDFNGPRAI